jgi:hypothetical protein
MVLVSYLGSVAMEGVLFTRLEWLFNDERAPRVVAGLLVGLLDDLNPHEQFLAVSESG